MTLGPYAAFIVGSYGLVSAVVVLLIGWIVLDHRAQQRRLRELERAGISRRSAQNPSDAA